MKNSFQVLHGRSKVMEWLKQQPDLGTSTDPGDISALTLLEIIHANHIDVDQKVFSMVTNFTFSESSGSVVITSPWDKPKLSVIYTGTDNPPLILSRDDEYAAALFITISGQEYLAASFRDGIRLWNLANNTSRVVYKFKKRNIWLLSLIDERTVASVPSNPLDGFINIHILNTNSKKWTLSSTHLVKANDYVCGITHVKTVDGTACLLLNYLEGLVQSVEMVGGKVRWQVDQQQTGEIFYPLSICTDGKTVFVSDIARLHLLSVDDGSVLTSINLSPLGIRYPSFVSVQEEHLYIGHPNEKKDTYCISKFTKPTEV